ncbi:nucleotidyltransferase [Cryptosporangium aurantiacum]|uniref:Nucleotidyltransferase domain-containing protein n=1 Tax=Cryptosporangium aurantiacum TaxID=134849 RepID=A0A1M7RD07_9ACTN|nr:nucleotidyltransferase [Cryptosporangium aurantiacum]SHN44042.1 hypothetical protein SAMN05443668_11031 [Cryptosporangium aurantiacum]
MDSEIQCYLDALVARAGGILDLTGAYAAGSIALDAYQPGRSDVDVALVVEDAVPDLQKRALVDALRHENFACPARGLELVVYRSAVARSGAVEPGFEVELNTGPRMDFRETHDPDARPAADGRFWYALDRSILHQSGRALLGAPADEMFADLASGDLQQLLLEALTWWLALPATEDAVLGACRSLVKHRYGRWLSKVDAGLRIASTGCSSELIERSIAARAGGPPPPGPEARAFQRWVIDEIRRVRPGSAG